MSEPLHSYIWKWLLEIAKLSKKKSGKKPAKENILDYIKLFLELRYLKESLSYATIYVFHSFSTNFRALYLTEFWTDFGQILDSKSYDQA